MDFAAIAEPLTRLLSPKVPWHWGAEQEEAVSILIHLITTAPVLRFFDPNRKTFVYTDASDFAIGGWLGQEINGKIHPISFWSRKMTSAERNYHIYDKELLALYSFIEHEAHLLRGIEFTANTDHRALEHLMSQETLRGRQIRWMMALQEYQLKIAYHPGAMNTVADWLTRNPDMETTCSKCHSHIQLKTVQTSTAESPFLAQVKNHYTADKFLQALVKSSTDPASLSTNQKILASKFVTRQGLWYYYDGTRMRLYIPDHPTLRSSILQRYHDAPIAGHHALVKTLRKIERMYYWPGLRLDVKAFIQTCETCQRQAEPSQAKYGLLHPLPIPEDRGDDVSIDFIFLGKSKEGKDSIMIIIDRLTKLVVLLPCHKTDSTEDSAKLFVKGWYTRGFGLPKTITSDRDPKFTSDLWQEIIKIVGIKQELTTARHQQANGQVEIQGRIAKRILRKYANYHQDNWEDMLPLVEFSMNNSDHSSTGYSPFYLFNGFEPRCFPSEIASHRGSSIGRKLLRLIGRELENAKLAIADAQVKMCDEYNKRHRPGEEIKAGDSVWLAAEGISWPVDTKRPKALLDTHLGPFYVKRGLDARNNVLLDLTPALAHVHPEFHISKLKLKPIEEPGRFPARPNQEYPEPIVQDDGAAVQEIEEILDQRLRNKKVQYLVKYVGFPWQESEWVDYSPDDSSWEEDMGLVAAFQRIKPLSLLYPGGQPPRPLLRSPPPSRPQRTRKG